VATSDPTERATGRDVTPAGRQDEPTVDADGLPLDTIDGVVFSRLAPHADHRGSLIEIVNFTQRFWEAEIVYAYCITILPGRIKGWGMHKLQADRYFLASGSVRVVLYDGREGSASYGQFGIYHLTRAAPGLLLIPPGVWHADQNWGDDEAIVINFPTRPYDPNAPDKYRIDPHSGEIPFDWTLRDG
jgi:dTDP-4-dehydrorhamnose 3,5-epimerase